VISVEDAELVLLLTSETSLVQILIAFGQKMKDVKRRAMPGMIKCSLSNTEFFVVGTKGFVEKAMEGDSYGY